MEDAMTKTVFVLGAGASLEFDKTGAYMPVGASLAQQIRAALTDELNHGQHTVRYSIGSALAANGGFSDEHRRAMNTIRKNIHTKASIDDLVDEWDDQPIIGEIAKLCIARQLLLAEQATSVHPGQWNPLGAGDALHGLRDSWIGQLHILHRQHEKIRRRNLDDVFGDLAFVTFNYDRTIEQYLYCVFSDLGDSPPAEAMARASDIPVLHVYGSLGPLSGKSVVPYGADENYLTLASSGIKTYTERVDSIFSQEISKLLTNAERVVFLGFAFHPQNREILGLDGSKLLNRAYASAFGMPPEQVSQLRSLLKCQYGQPTIAQETCGHFISSYKQQIFGPLPGPFS